MVGPTPPTSDVVEGEDSGVVVACVRRARPPGTTSSSLGRSTDVRRLRDPGPRARRRAARLLRPASRSSTAVRSRPESPCPKKGRLTVLRDLGLVTQVFNEQKLHGLPRRARDRAHAVLDDRLERLGERPAARPARPGAHDRARAQRQSRQRVRAARRAGRRGHPALVHVGLGADRGADRERRAAARGGGRRGDAPARGRVLDHRARGGQAARVPRPARLPAARPRPSRTTTRWSPPRPARSTCSARRSSARSAAASSSSSTTRGTRSIQAVEPRRAAARSASSSSSTSRAPTRTWRASRCTARACAWASGSPHEAPVEADLVLPIPDSGTPAAIGFSRASGIPFSEGLIKNRYVGPHVHPARPGAARAGHPAQVQPARRGRRKARRRRRRLDRAREHDAADRRDALRRRRRRGARARLVAARRSGRASTGSTSPDEDELIAAARTVDEVRELHRRDLARLPLARRPHGVDAAGPGSSLCRACLTREYPTRVPEDRTLAKLRFEPARA